MLADRSLSPARLTRIYNRDAFGREQLENQVASEEEDYSVMVPTGAVAALCNPFKAVCWHLDLDRPMRRAEIRRAIDLGKLLAPGEGGSEGHRKTRQEHVRRIAWFAVHGWNDSISIDVGAPAFGHTSRWPVDDGNHRLAAAIYRGDPEIRADVGGQISFAIELGLLPKADPGCLPHP